MVKYVLGVTQVKQEDYYYIQGRALNAMRIRSAWEFNRKRKLGRDTGQRSCFGIATDAHALYFLEYILGYIPMIIGEIRGDV